MPLDLGMKILLVEDSGTMRKMEVKLLGKLGFTNVVEAEDGEKALPILSSDPDIRLVISDWAMPNKDGHELLLWIRANAPTATLPFIMATGQGDKEYVAQAMASGANSVVPKPFSPDEMKERIEEIFGERKVVVETAAPAEVKNAEGKILLRAAHIQITDHLTLGMVKAGIASNKYAPKSFELETKCLPNWNRVQEALEKHTVDAAFILAPAAMDLFRYGTPLRLVLFAHRNGSIMVRSAAGDYRKPYQAFFKHRTFFIPFKMSVHHMLAHKYFSEMGLKPGIPGKEPVNVSFDVVAPIDMPPFLKENTTACGFMVAEPIGSRAVAAGIAERQILSSEIWENHPCCVVVFRQEFLEAHPDAVQEFVKLVVDAGKSIMAEPENAAEVAVSFLDPQKAIGLTVPLLKTVLTEPKGIRTDDLYPDRADLDMMQKYMTERMGVGGLVDLGAFVDTRFADAACGERAVAGSTTGVAAKKTDLTSLMTETKKTAGREGKYLVYELGGERYGISVLDVREIIRIVPITPVPMMPHGYKGIINLRGKVIPVLDLRVKFGMDAAETDERTCIIVIEVSGTTGSKLVGTVVDTVLEVSDIREEIIQDPPDMGGAVETSSMLGMAKMQAGVTILLDVDKVVGA